MTNRFWIFCLCLFLLLAPAYSASLVISTGKSVTVSDYYSVYYGSYLTDGNMGTSWNGNTYNSWAQIDLGSTMSLDKAIYYAGAGPSSSETFGLYIDNVLVASQSVYIPTGSLTPVIFDFPDQVGRYVKITISAASSWVAAAEFEVYSAVPEPATWLCFALFFAAFLKKALEARKK